MWHASGRAANEATAWAIAGRALLGVGDEKLGEWREVGERGIVHLRRRLSSSEMELAGLEGARDIRGSAEEQARLSSLFHAAPYLRPVATFVVPFREHEGEAG